MERSAKRDFVSSLREELDEQGLVILAQQKGMTVSQMDQLRAQARQEGACVRVVKNSLARLALGQTPLEPLQPFFIGPIMVASSRDPVSAARVVIDFSKENSKLSPIVGFSQGRLLEKETLDFLASLPSVDVLRAKLMAVLLAPATRLVRTLQLPGESLARLMSRVCDVRRDSVDC